MQPSAEQKRFQKRAISCAVIVGFLFFILILRLFYLQLIEHRMYATLSRQNVISVVPITPERGIIYDRNGVVLAENSPVYSLTLTTARTKDVNDTLKALIPIVDLSPNEIKAFLRIRNQYYPYQPIPLKKTLTEAEVDRFYVNAYRFPGVNIQTTEIRNYPLGASMSAVIGYVGRITAKEYAEVDPTNYTLSDDIGKAGVEAEDEVLLHGKAGSEQAEIDANGKIVRILKKNPATPGDNLYLTIDSKLQQIADNAMGNNTGAIVAIQPSTGQVLALVTKPSYDPNAFTGHMTEQQYKDIILNPDHPLVNRATGGAYAPGSTVKPFIAFYALSHHIIDTQDYIYDPGWFRLPHTTHIYHNWTWTLHHSGMGWVNVTRAIISSCDTFFYQLAVVLGIDRLDDALTQFGFGQLTGINLPLEIPGVVPSPQWKEAHVDHPWYEGDTVITGIGQGFTLVTPLQLAAAVSTLANRGQRVQPSVLLKIQQPDGITTTMAPILQSAINTDDPKAWHTVIQAMTGVVDNNEGTAHYAWGSATSYTVAAKTGTAQVVGDKDHENETQSQLPFKERDNHWLVAFAPVKNPQIAIAVIVEHNPIAVQVARKVLDFYMNEQANQPAQNATPTTNNTTTPNTPALPAPTTNSGNALPAPESQSQIQDDLQNDLQQELRLQKADQHSQSEALQTQMDMHIDQQVELESQDENTATSAAVPQNPSNSDGQSPFKKMVIEPVPQSSSAAAATTTQPAAPTESAVPAKPASNTTTPQPTPTQNQHPTPAIQPTNPAQITVTPVANPSNANTTSTTPSASSTAAPVVTATPTQKATAVSTPAVNNAPAVNATPNSPSAQPSEAGSNATTSTP